MSEWWEGRIWIQNLEDGNVFALDADAVVKRGQRLMFLNECSVGDEFMVHWRHESGDRAWGGPYRIVAPRTREITLAVTYLGDWDKAREDIASTACPSCKDCVRAADRDGPGPRGGRLLGAKEVR